MRSCDETLELISAALDGALTGEEQAALDEHLSRCPVCSALFAELSGLHTAAGELEDLSAPAGFADQVMARIAADPAQEQPGNVVPFPVKKSSRTPWKGLAVTAAMVAVVALGAATLSGHLGAGSQSTADCAAPAQAENTYADPTEESGTAEPFSLIPEADEEKAVTGTSRTDTGGEEMESKSAFADDRSANDDESAEVLGTSDTMGNASSPLDPAESPAVYCGVLTLTDGPLPEGLEGYEATEDESGRLIYMVPADYFFSCLAVLKTEQPDRFTCDLDQEGAEYGLIIVTAPAEP